MPSTTRSRQHGTAIGAAVGFAILTMATHGLNFGFTVAATRLLPAEAFGTLTAVLGLVLVGMAPGMAVQGLSAADVLDGSTTIDRRLAGQAAVTMVLAVTLGLAVTGSALGIESPATVIAVGLAAGLLPLTGANEGRLQGTGRFLALGTVLVAGAATKFVLGIAGMAWSGTVWAATVGVLAGYAVQALASHRASGGLDSASVRSVDAVRTVTTGTVMMGLVLLVLHVDTVLARALLPDPDSAGLYATGSTAARIVFWAPQFAVHLLYPRLVVDPRRRTVAWALVGLAAAGVVAVLAAQLLGPWFVELVFPAVYAPIGEELWRFTWLGTAAVGLQVVALSDLATGRREALVVLAGVLATVVAATVLARPSTPRQLVTTAAGIMTVGVVVALARRLTHITPPITNR